MSSAENLTLQQVKKLGPFPDIELQITLRKNLVRIIGLIREENNPSITIEIGDALCSVGEVAEHILAALMVHGLITAATRFSVVDLDKLAEVAC